MDEATWRSRAAMHEARVDTFVAPHLARRSERVKHPVHDFLFTYYSQRPARLRRWHPGYGVGLAGGGEYAGLKGYEVVSTGSTTEVVTVSAEYVASQRPMIESLHMLLTATAGRTPSYGCFGLHEWAMVYRMSEEQTRPSDWPLRLGPEATDAVVESHRIACSHFD